MRNLLFSLALVGGMIIGGLGFALASQPPGQLGYEGQPGNQGGGQHQHAPGLLGYEGQPGNQGG